MMMYKEKKRGIRMKIGKIYYNQGSIYWRNENDKTRK